MQSSFKVGRATVVSDWDAEQSIIGRVLVSPILMDEVSARLQPQDFAHPFHASLIRLLSSLIAEGRTPSLQSVLAIVGDQELEPNLSVRSYLSGLMAHQPAGNLVPLADAIEVVRDKAQRTAVATIANMLAARAVAQDTSVADMATDAVHALDDVLSSVRQGKTDVYDLDEAAERALRHHASSDRVYPTTGLSDLDRIIGGWPLGQLSIWAGRPGMGKSACATSAVFRAAQAGHGVGFFSLEMQGEQLGSRILTDLAFSHDDPIHYEDMLNRREIPEHHMRRLIRAKSVLKEMPVQIEERRDLTMAEIAARTRKMANAFDRAGRKLSVVFVDHMGLVTPSGRYKGNRVNEVGEISSGLATLAKDLDIAVVALCQLNRAVEGRDNKRPGLSDLRDSGSIEQDASVVVFTFRPAYYFEQRQDDPSKEQDRLHMLEKTRNKLELAVAKNRNGRVGTVDAFVDIGANAIRNSAHGRF